jgi:hypothetical protein
MTVAGSGTVSRQVRPGKELPMRRSLQWILSLAAAVALPFGLSADEPLTVHLTPWGPSEAAIEAAKADLIGSPLLQPFLRNAQFRILSFRLIPPADRPGPPQPPEDYRAAIFDYTHNRTIVAEGSIQGGVTSAGFSPEQPVPSIEEFDAAVEVVRTDPEFGGPLSRGEMQAYPPMPPLSDGIGPMAQRPERTVNVGLVSKTGDAVQNQIIGVNMIRRTVVRYPKGAPPKAIATPDVCGFPYGIGPGETGDPSYHVTVNQGPTTIWDFIVWRPTYSSGANGSGVDVQSVKYLGRQVLARGHMPILNVLYLNNGCGPYRDWLTSQHVFEANGTDVGNGGFRICTGRPQTLAENGSDNGNFNGVAIYVKGNSVYLTGNHEAGWYRYPMEWRFDADGSIHPRFGFVATDNSCVCVIHTHHGYFRFDWDIEQASHDIVYEDARGGTTQLVTESMRRRVPSGPAAGRTWRVQNSTTGDGYRIISGNDDATADAYGAGDLWFLQYHSNEIDDSGAPCSPPWCVEPVTMARLDAFLNGESIANQNIVLWYGVHEFDDTNDENSEVGRPFLGPDLVPVQW